MSNDNNTKSDSFDPERWVIEAMLATQEKFLADKTLADEASQKEATKEKKTRAKKAKKADGSEESPNKAKPGRIIPNFPAPCTDDYQTFVTKIQHCGYDLVNGRWILRKKLESTDEVYFEAIRALQSFVGYAFDEPFGVQLDHALREVLRLRRLDSGELAENPVIPSRVNHSVAGYVAGVPDKLRADILNIMARVKVASEAYDLECKRRQQVSEDDEYAWDRATALVESKRKMIRHLIGELHGLLEQHPDAQAFFDERLAEQSDSFATATEALKEANG